MSAGRPENSGPDGYAASTFTDGLRKDAESGDNCEGTSQRLAMAADMIDACFEHRPLQVVAISEFDRLAVLIPVAVDPEQLINIGKAVAKWADMPEERVAVLDSGATLVGLKDEPKPRPRSMVVGDAL